MIEPCSPYSGDRATHMFNKSIYLIVSHLSAAAHIQMRILMDMHQQTGLVEYSPIVSLLLWMSIPLLVHHFVWT